MPQENTSKTEIKFPATWYGSLITTAESGDATPRIREIFSRLPLENPSVTAGRSSAGGKYRTWQMSAVIPDLETLRKLTAALEQVPGKKMLI